MALPTGLGKTFIAANIILNFYKWFPEGKILFLAPTRPLVTQQFSTITEIESIDHNDVCEVSGLIPPQKRAKLYQYKRIFISTPQAVENDLDRGILNPECVVCVIFGN